MMLPGLFLTLGSLPMIVLLYLVYISQGKTSFIRAVFYQNFLYVGFTMSFTEILAAVFLYDNLNVTVGLILLRISWFSGFLFFYLLYYYADTLYNDVDNVKISEILFNKKHLYYNIISIICVILYFILPFKGLDYNNLVWIFPVAPYVIFFHGGLTLTILVIKFILLDKSKKTKSKRLYLWIAIAAMLCLLVLQFTFKHIAFEPVIVAALIYAYYFMYENPDIYILKETQKVQLKKTFIKQKQGLIIKSLDKEITSSINDIYNLSKKIKFSEKNDNKELMNDLSSLLVMSNDLINKSDNLSFCNSSATIINKSNFSIEEVINDVVKKEIKLLSNKKVKFNIIVSPSTPIVLNGDEDKIYDIIKCAISNSIKTTTYGKITINISYSNNNLIIKITDSGDGLNKEKYNELMSILNDNFELLNDYYINNLIIKKYADLLGGTFVIKSNELSGTNIKVTIPVINVSNETIGKYVYSSDEKEIDCCNFKLAIIDNDLDYTKLLSNYIKNYKFNIEIFSDNNKFINKIKLGEKYDIAICNPILNNDIETLPKITKLLKEKSNYDVPILVVHTFDKNYKFNKKYKTYGYNEYLNKPFDKSQFNKIIKKYLIK